MLKSHLVKRLGLLVSLCFGNIIAFSQTVETNSASFDATMRSNDKIYVVMAVCITILVIIFLYLIRIDTKISKKEK